MSIVRSLAVLLSTLLAAGSLTQAQDLTNTSLPESPQQIRIQVTDQQDPSAKSNTEQAHPISVTVTDGQGHPVPNATVLFRLPADGPRGLFDDGSRVQVVTTDMAGQAAIRNIRWDTTPGGTAVIRVTATKGIAHAGLLIEQSLDKQPQKKESAMTAAAMPETRKIAEAASPAVAHAAIHTPGTSVNPERLAAPGTPADTTQTAKATLPGTDDAATPHVTISNRPTGQVTGAEGHSRKWLWVGIAGAAAAGMAFAFMGHGGGGTAATTNPSLSIGAPTVSIGH